MQKRWLTSAFLLVAYQVHISRCNGKQDITIPRYKGDF
ncbi:hypothetical protein VEA_004079 [Vibrio antiquarius]|uniref:Uncharacterized protein n=1 Tax=Vibrio antiquarius (strain Ex25) TaxID=150340 RepID=A0ACA6QP03_VIBAE|nr:hypothetical protein VEA_004079 [Vibrio antiquarius]